MCEQRLNTNEQSFELSYDFNFFLFSLNILAFIKEHFPYFSKEIKLF
jgi:hypothetical protein